MSPNIPGLCLVINQRLFYADSNIADSVKLCERPGTEQDRENIERCFTLLGRG